MSILAEVRGFIFRIIGISPLEGFELLILMPNITSSRTVLESSELTSSVLVWTDARAATEVASIPSEFHEHGGELHEDAD